MTQILVCKFVLETDKTYEYLYHGEHLSPGNYEQSPLFAIINRDEFMDPNGHIFAIPKCENPANYRVIRVVEIKDHGEEDYEGPLKPVVGVITPDLYIKTITNLRKRERLEKKLQKAIKRGESLAKLSKLAESGNGHTKELFNDYLDTLSNEEKAGYEKL